MTTPRPPHRPDRRPATTARPPAPPMLPVPERLIRALEQLTILADDVARVTNEYQASLARQQSDNSRRAADTRRTRDDDQDRTASDGRGVDR